VLVFENIGAYSVTEAMGLFLSRTLPRIVMLKGGLPRLVRDRKESWMINIQDM
jgi:diaminopimelate decarboxylase